MVVSLIAIAGLLLENFWRLSQVDLGFSAAQLSAFQVQLEIHDRSKWEQQSHGFAENLRQRIQRIPGVMDAATTTSLPFRGRDIKTWVPQAESESQGVTQERIAVNARFVSPEFIRLLGIRTREGRVFSEKEPASDRLAAVVSLSLAQGLFEGRAVGRTLKWGRTFEIVGIVDDVRWRRPGAPPEPAFYLPIAENPTSVVAVIARTDLDLATFATEAINAVRGIDARQPLEQVTTIERVVDEALAEQRFSMLATGVFGLLALALVGIAVFAGVEAALSERTREIALRYVLGARPGQVRWIAMRQGLVPVLAGVCLGCFGAMVAVRFLQSLLFEVTSTAVWALGIAPAFVVTVAVAAAWLPSRRAVVMDPASVLRDL
jgi:putative ABC transport system permease protein